MRAGDLVEAVGRLVRVESPSEDPAACERAVEEAASLCREWLPGEPRVEYHGGWPILRWGPAQPKVLLLGHLDTVWPIGTLQRLPWSVEGDRMRGPGVFDMKTGVVQGLAAVAQWGGSAQDGVGIMLTTDEETGSATSKLPILDAAARASAVLVLEPSLDGALKTARKGTSWYRLQFEGLASHAGLDPERGINALLLAAQLAGASVHWANSEYGTTLVPTTMTAGTTANTVPAEAELTIDIRSWQGSEQERIDALLRSWDASPGSMRIVEGGINRSAMEPIASAGLFEQAQLAAAEIGLPPLEQASVGGASDGNFTAAAGVPTLDGLGAVGDGAHADHEWASITGLAERTGLLAALVARSLVQPDIR